MSDDLEPLAPSEALDLYLNGRDELSAKTADGQKYRLRAFVQWCDEEGISNLNNVSGRDLYRYRVWRRDGGYSGDELKTVTLRGDMATLRAFLKFCASIDGVDEGLFEQVPLPQLDVGGDVSDTTLDADRAVEILDYLGTYQYASRTHVIMLVLWHTGCRVGALRGLDLGDLDLEGDRAEADGPAIHFVHRPAKDTPLKNSERGERWNAISSQVAEVLQKYIEGPRIDVVDDYNREPLVTTDYGRMSASAMRNTLYRITRPCWRGEDCPHDRDIGTCEAANDDGKFSTCPSARSPHDVRSGRVTAFRREDVDRVLVSERMDASEDVLDKHYDRRSSRQKAAQRRRFLDL